MKLYLHQSGTWIVSFRTKHGCKRLNTKQTDRRLAELVVKEARIEQIELARTINLVASAASMHALCGRVVTSRDAFKEWLDHLQASHPSGTVIRYERVVKLFLNRMHWPKMLSEIRSVSIDSWINSTESEAHAQTRNVHRSGLNSFFKFCANEGWCNNPVPNVRIKRHLLTHEQNESKLRRPLTSEEFTRLVAVTQKEPMPYWYGMVMIGRYTGMRFADVQGMELASIAPDKITVWTAKRTRRVELPMPPELPPVFDLLAKHPMNQPLGLPTSPKGRVFNQIPVEVWAGAPLGFRRLSDAAGLPKEITFHCIRHTYAVELAKSGIGLKEISQRMAHFGEKTTLHYLRTLLNDPQPKATGRSADQV